MRSTPRFVALAFSFVALTAPLAACGSSEPAEAGAAAAAESSAADLRTVSADDGAALAEAPPAGLVVLDIRTPEEFASGHLEGATMIDFYEPDFADRLAALDPTVPYLLYCNSGNRSGQALGLMADLGFTDVTEIDGGIQAWVAGGFPVTTS